MTKIIALLTIAIVAFAAANELGHTMQFEALENDAAPAESAPLAANEKFSPLDAAAPVKQGASGGNPNQFQAQQWPWWGGGWGGWGYRRFRSWGAPWWGGYGGWGGGWGGYPYGPFW
jgi:hypothetical protein